MLIKMLNNVKVSNKLFTLIDSKLSQTLVKENIEELSAKEIDESLIGTEEDNNEPELPGDGSGESPDGDVNGNNPDGSVSDSDSDTGVSDNNPEGDGSQTTHDWGDITEEDRAEYGLVKEEDISQALWVAGIKDSIYTGKKITFENLYVYHYKDMLRQGTDYTVSYSKNIKAGSSLLTIKGKGNYTGTVKREYQILPIDLSTVVLTDTAVKYNGKVQKATTTVLADVNGEIITLKKCLKCNITLA